MSELECVSELESVGMIWSSKDSLSDFKWKCLSGTCNNLPALLYLSFSALLPWLRVWPGVSPRVLQVWPNHRLWEPEWRRWHLRVLWVRIKNQYYTSFASTSTSQGRRKRESIRIWLFPHFFRMPTAFLGIKSLCVQVPVLAISTYSYR